jgi:hypothetical protein
MFENIEKWVTHCHIQQTSLNCYFHNKAELNYGLSLKIKLLLVNLEIQYQTETECGFLVSLLTASIFFFFISREYIVCKKNIHVMRVLLHVLYLKMPKILTHFQISPISELVFFQK